MNVDEHERLSTITLRHKLQIKVKEELFYWCSMLIVSILEDIPQV